MRFSKEGLFSWGLCIIGLTAIGGLTLFFGTAMFADHSVANYYLEAAVSGRGVANVTCVIANNPWQEDTTAFCSQDEQKALDFAQKANDLLKRK